jgi:putative AlgH/UPF0301 family transcriptional regulator
MVQRIFKRRRLERDLNKIRTKHHPKKSTKSFSEHETSESLCEHETPEEYLDNEYKSRMVQLGKLIKILPFVVPFIKRIPEFIKIRLLCKKLRDVSSKNFFWQIVVSNHCDKLYLMSNPYNVEKSLVEQKELIAEYVNASAEKVENLKLEGNAKYIEKDFPEALRRYYNTLVIIKDFLDLHDKNPIAKSLLSKKTKTFMFKKILVVHANICQCLISKHSYESAFTIGKRALTFYNKILEINNFSKEIVEEMKDIYKKLRDRIKVARQHTPIAIGVRYSAQRYPGLQVGSLITSTSHIGAGIFYNSKVLITKYTEDRGYEGIIINKAVTAESGRRVNVGGPCEMFRRTTLHNVANTPDAVEILPGLYMGGTIDGFVPNPNRIVREFYGYASWFEGQLDGELFNDDWTLTNGITALQILE